MSDPTKRVLRRAAVMERIGLRATALNDAVKRGEFPKPIKLSEGGRAVAWLEQEVDEWLAARVAQRNAAAAEAKPALAPARRNPSKRKAARRA